MTIAGGGHGGSGLDRALQQALNAGLDETLETGEIWPGESEKYPDPTGEYDPTARPWQMALRQRRDPPAADESLRTVVAGLRTRAISSTKGQAPAAAAPGSQAAPLPPAAAPARPPGGPAGDGGGSGEAYASGEASGLEKDARSWLQEHLPGEGERSEAQRYKASFRFRDQLTGVVMVHGIGPQRAGQTLLNWARPIITLIGDACAGDPGLARLDADPRRLPGVSDPVFRSSIDFSGETFPVLQLRIPRRTDVPADDPRGQERRWIMTETWWASEVRPPTLGTMVGWLGEQGGVGRIVQGIQENMLGRGVIGKVAQVSLQAFVSVIVSFALLVFVALLAITRVIPVGPLKDAVNLRTASSFITDWFGGARTLLRDPAQSANVRGRLVATVKALRAYGCRQVVIVAHSGGTMVSLMTLTDPAYPRLRVEKLITIGEALNLGWRLEDANPDVRPATPAEGNRMRGDLATHQPRLKWRDFWATHDPAPSGPPMLPAGMTDPGPTRFTAERVYNRMSLGEDHGGYWDNDEHFLIPLIREIDTATGDRGASRFYSDAAESDVRARRKERVGLLSLWRRATLALPVMAILAAALVTSGSLVREAGDLALAVLGLVPGHEAVGSAAQTLAGNGDRPVFSQFPDLTWHGLYGLGLSVVQIVFLLLIGLVILPGRVDRLWRGRPISRLVLVAIEWAIGPGLLLLIVAGLIAATGSFDSAGRAALDLLSRPAVGLVALIGGLWLLGRFGRLVRSVIARSRGQPGIATRLGRDVLIILSAVFLGSFLVLLLMSVLAVVLVFVGNTAVANADETRRFILGAIVVLVGYQGLARLGTWRWDSWDGRERRALRRRPRTYPFRLWVYVLAVMLAAAAVFGALIVARGSGGDLPILVAWVLAIVMLSVGKDVVDSDLEPGSGGGGATEAGWTGSIAPSPPGGPPAGSSAA